MRKRPVLTTALAHAIVNRVAEGLPIKFAAALEGIDEKTVQDWLYRGECSTEQPYHDFANSAEGARREAIARALAVIGAAAAGGDKGARRWLIERGIQPEDPTGRKSPKTTKPVSVKKTKKPTKKNPNNQRG